MAEGAGTVLICGGTSRGGLDVARLLSARNLPCIVAGRHPPEGDAAGDAKLIYEQVDFASPASVTNFGDRLAKSTHDIGCCVFFQRARSEDLLESMQVAVASSAAVISALEAKLTARSGSVVFIASIIGEKVGKEQTLAYHVSKGSLGPAVRYLAVRYGGRIRVNAISLSTFQHSRNAGGYDAGTPLHAIVGKLIPTGRATTADDVANVIAFLSGPGAAAITGQVIDVDGGLGVLSQVTSAIHVMS